MKHLMHLWKRWLTCLGELHRFLEMVIIDSTSNSVLPTLSRKQELETVVSLLGEAQQQALVSVQHDLGVVVCVIKLALPSLLRFAHRLEESHQQVVSALGGVAVHLIAWGHGSGVKLRGSQRPPAIAGIGPSMPCYSSDAL